MRRNRIAQTFRPRLISLAVEGGQVVCLARGAVDIERCFTCRAYRGLQDGPNERLVCSPGARSNLTFIPLVLVPH